MLRFTLYGAYQYDPTLFDGIVLPDGMDSEILVAEIISKSGDLYPYYQVPAILKQNISYWFLRRKFDFSQMYRALTLDYNPIENYDRYEILSRKYANSGSDSTERTNRNVNKITNESDLGSTTKTTLGTKTESDRIGTDALSVSAYNAADYQSREKTDTTDNLVSQNSGTDTVTTSGGDTITTNGTTTINDDSTITYGAKRNEDESNRIHGNIGVTTSQQMIEAEEEVRKKYDIYSMIASLFEKEFIVQIY